jgi:hypothetical protein
MGQYFLIVNVTKKEYIHPQYFRDGLKLGEQGTSIEIFNMLMIDKKTEQAYSVIMSANKQSLYTFPSNLLGSWKDDEIVFAGDYSKKNKYYELCLKNEESEYLPKDSYINIVNYFINVDKKLVRRFNFVSNKKKCYYYNIDKRQCYISGCDNDDEYDECKNYILYLISDDDNNKYSWDSDKLIVSETEISDHNDYSMIIIDKEPNF